MTLRFASAGIGAGLFVLALASSGSAQSLFATQVVSFNQGTGGGIFTQSNVLGGPQGQGLGAGSLDVLTLGEGGSVVLGFDVTIVDGPGADLTVWENGFVVGGSSVFAEILYVEVSSNGTDFARFPTSYPGSGSKMGSFRGLSGGMPGLANVVTNTISPFDAAVSGGESFDLADLASDPLVTSGTVDLGAIAFVRLVDVLAGESDAQGVALPGDGAPDVDAVAVLNGGFEVLGDQPVCDVRLDALGRIVLTIGHPQGLGALDLGSFASSMNLALFPFDVLLPYFQVSGFSGTELELTSVPLGGLGFVGALGVSIADASGNRSTDQLMIQS